MADLRRCLALLVAATVLTPGPGQGQGPAGAPRNAVPEAAAPSGSEAGPPLPEQSHARLERELAVCVGELAEASSQLAEAMKRLSESRKAQDRVKKMQEDEKALRGLLRSLEDQLRSGRESQQQSEDRLSDVTVQSAEYAALLSVAAAELQSCTAEGRALSQGAERHRAQAATLQRRVGLLEATIGELERSTPLKERADAGSADYAAGLERGRSLLELQLEEQRRVLAERDEEIARQEEEISAGDDEAAERDEEIAALKKELAASRERLAALSPLEKRLKDQHKALADRDEELARVKKARGEQIARLKKDLATARREVSSLQVEREEQAQTTVQLVRKARESVSRLVELERRYSALANELSALQQRVGVPKALPPGPAPP